MKYPLFILCAFAMVAVRASTAVVVDAATGDGIPGVTVFNNNGALLGMCSDDGVLPYVTSDDYPISLKCMGYDDAYGLGPQDSVIVLREASYVLPEVIVESKRRTVLHILAYVRDYSTLSTYSDTVKLFREKWIDFMVPAAETKRFKGWRSPRVLSTKSYYNFRNSNGLDSVSDRYNQHFSWTDWVGVFDRIKVPEKLRDRAVAADTVYGRYSPAEIWRKNGDDLTLSVDVLSDTLRHRWVSGFSPFFRENLDFELFNIRYNFVEAVDTLSTRDISGMSCNIESRGRGHNMYRFNRFDEPYFVSTYAEIYFVDREYLTMSDAKKWEKRFTDMFDIDSRPPTGMVPDLSPETATLVTRVNNINHDKVRIQIEPDQRLAGIDLTPLTTTQKVIRFLKGLVPQPSYVVHPLRR